ncbi:MAG: alpha-1,4-glucan--maltose-1-phosphate maltosyltransferase [Candidatus Omnitrophica bacterium CG11_big_fil_rev_8_21_14_0_20_45_26]|uniref:Alpha-1,4-glucan:maltose-1-phosphate maltosyltransferase n=1 Tax=Candidatus Abzuiibacterium crystallinum TaxID=1974748 RepID=A0A2H0LTQ4_9BACT|nr:MAG: alpha-1,4-glucan--maltose-1-phosphate maltosyltransferase [Candidatus Omnitrophica bacterium CG11_big_fil_rev_8_21_14_0_20_45_26]PIW64592.1 MAG: alpha-1,4-glucan--maltose-1-phosphate maltosyltransferase [Candidatus Omnitrophica bacterium CG12_big_fil_rev_8_21_14_0_65_45_16]
MPADLFQAIVIENVMPTVAGGLYSLKWIAGIPCEVTADIFKDSHENLAARLLWRELSQETWSEAEMIFVNNDNWKAVLKPERHGNYVYQIEAWVDPMLTWLDHVEKKALDHQCLKSEVKEGLRLLDEIMPHLSAVEQTQLKTRYQQLETAEGVSEEVLRVMKDEGFLNLVRRVSLKRQMACSALYPLTVDRKRAEFGSWYELFPRSQGQTEGKSATFQDCIKRLPDIKKLGFNVLYLPPIHPIGTTNRKGPNNSLTAGQNSPGSPWAIGSPEGGHKAIHPDLGTMQDFEDFLAAAQDYGIEIALDFAVQCSPDHPYVKEHPDWFYKLPDGSIRYAENPPKKYQDIYPINLMCADREALWQELKSIVDFWIEKGVKIFRVDNPHTKPYRFWQWLIREVKKNHPETIFLAEAFTRPKVMKFLAKIGFTQSYTYFTWRHTKRDLQQYLEELTKTDMINYFRPNFFVNTPDILSDILQKGGRPAFQMRLVLAATLAPTYGIYSGFELCENKALHEGSEEYLDSEKYQYKVWDWNRPGNIKELVTQINRIRNENAALQQFGNLTFFATDTDHILAYAKWNADQSNLIFAAVNLDPYHIHEDYLHMPLWQFGIQDWQTFQVKDLLTGEKYYWKGPHQYVRLDPQITPAHIFLVRKK